MRAFTAREKLTPEEYAEMRAKQTGRPYLVTGMGHAWLADTHNRQQAADFGGIMAIFYPSGWVEITD